MDRGTAERLLALNREFYTAFAQSFAGSRQVTDPALTAILPHIPSHAQVLDVGCGNGRLALLLDRERPGATYLGLDAAAEMIAAARAQADLLTNISAQFRVADVTRPDWSLEIGHWRLITCLAVLHHIPGFDLRLRVLRDLAGLLEPGGVLILSTWQFITNERMRRKIVAWSRVDVKPDALEVGDYLLDWKRGGQGLRYCHMVDEDEVRQLAAASGFRVRQIFRAGGREGNLSLFAVLDFPLQGRRLT